MGILIERRSRWLVFWALVTTVVPTQACSECNASGSTAAKAPIVVADGESTGTLYESAPWDGDWLFFPPGTVYRFEHGLGTEHIVVQAYVAFERRPFEGDPPPGAAQSAGDLSLLEAVTADTFDLRNNTCAELYLRAVAIAPGVTLSEGGAGGAR